MGARLAIFILLLVVVVCYAQDSRPRHTAEAGVEKKFFVLKDSTNSTVVFRMQLPGGMKIKQRNASSL